MSKTWFRISRKVSKRFSFPFAIIEYKWIRFKSTLPISYIRYRLKTATFREEVKRDESTSVESSGSLPLLGNPSPHSGSHDRSSGQLGLLPTSRLLSIRFGFLPIRVLRFLLDIRSLLVHQMGFLAMERLRSASILALR